MFKANKECKPLIHTIEQMQMPIKPLKKVEIIIILAV